MTTTTTRASEVAQHLRVRAAVNASVRDREPIDYRQVREWAPMLLEAAELLDAAAKYRCHACLAYFPDHLGTCQVPRKETGP